MEELWWGGEIRCKEVHNSRADAIGLLGLAKRGWLQRASNGSGKHPPS
jgi:hypothetical protein